MTNIFAACKTLDELKKAYKAAALKNHPDLGGDTATMQQINAEFDPDKKNFCKWGLTFCVP